MNHKSLKYEFTLAILKIFGEPKTSNDFSFFFDENLYREILFSICLYIINYKIDEYEKEDIIIFSNFIYKYQDDNTSIKDIISIINLINSR